MKHRHLIEHDHGYKEGESHRGKGSQLHKGGRGRATELPSTVILVDLARVSPVSFGSTPLGNTLVNCAGETAWMVPAAARAHAEAILAACEAIEKGVPEPEVMIEHRDVRIES